MAPSRNFDGNDDVITLSLGALNFVSGPFTVAAIVRKASDPVDQPYILKAGVDIATGWIFYIRGTGQGNWLALYNGSTEVNSGITLTAAEGWALVAITKTSGTTAVVGYKYVYSTVTFTSGGSATQANSATPATSAGLGAFVSAGAGNFHGDIAIVGAWNVVLTSAQIEGLALAESAWLAAAPSGLWILDQTNVGQSVLDETGNGADQSAITGTTIGEDFNFPLIGNRILKPNVLRPAMFAPGRAR